MSTITDAALQSATETFSSRYTVNPRFDTHNVYFAFTNL